MTVSTSTKTLSKLGADLRWYMEQNGVDAEAAAVVITVKHTTAQSRLITGFLQDFDSSIMRRMDKFPNMIVVHGVTIWVGVEDLKPKEAA